MHILYRNINTLDYTEKDCAQLIFKNHFHLYRSTIPHGSTVIGRYSVLPFYKELEEELALKDSHLINSYIQHKFIADMEWYGILNDMTPRTFFNHGYLNAPHCQNGWVVKGKTNSRKFLWNTHMYASNRTELKNVINNLLDDQFISEQGIVIRQYVPLKTIEEGINGLRFTKEYRYFFLNGTLISKGFYWSNIEEKLIPYSVPAKCDRVAFAGAERLKDYVNFFVIDIAETQAGEPIIIEVNDGQMSGISTIDPTTFYQNINIIA